MHFLIFFPTLPLQTKSVEGFNLPILLLVLYQSLHLTPTKKQRWSQGYNQTHLVYRHAVQYDLKHQQLINIYKTILHYIFVKNTNKQHLFSHMVISHWRLAWLEALSSSSLAVYPLDRDRHSMASGSGVRMHSCFRHGVLSFGLQLWWL